MTTPKPCKMWAVYWWTDGVQAVRVFQAKKPALWMYGGIPNANLYRVRVVPIVKRKSAKRKK